MTNNNIGGDSNVNGSERTDGKSGVDSGSTPPPEQQPPTKPTKPDRKALIKKLTKEAIKQYETVLRRLADE